MFLRFTAFAEEETPQRDRYVYIRKDTITAIQESLYYFHWNEGGSRRDFTIVVTINTANTSFFVRESLSEVWDIYNGPATYRPAFYE